MSGVDNGASSERFEKVPTPTSGSTTLDKLEEPQINGALEQNNLSQESEDELCAALVKTIMERDKRDAQLMLESHQLLAARNYKMIILLGTKGVWT